MDDISSIKDQLVNLEADIRSIREALRKAKEAGRDTKLIGSELAIRLREKELLEARLEGYKN